ncbi:hypothetical protein X777_13879 [Ooceraea biroi]|uniref:Uncharacterized protein n=1 Tax=Ooceraea biroi TaxID=2015173 RepID=A0A026VZQ8_OOCBI|nr:hypothetical protein X777_13879 [Ooceraea biroi]
MCKKEKDACQSCDTVEPDGAKVDIDLEHLSGDNNLDHVNVKADLGHDQIAIVYSISFSRTGHCYRCMPNTYIDINFDTWKNAAVQEKEIFLVQSRLREQEEKEKKPGKTEKKRERKTERQNEGGKETSRKHADTEREGVKKSSALRRTTGTKGRWGEETRGDII